MTYQNMILELSNNKLEYIYISRNKRNNSLVRQNSQPNGQFLVSMYIRSSLSQLGAWQKASF